MSAEQRRICGPGSLSELGSVLDEVGARRVLLVTGTGSFASSGAEEALRPSLAGRAVTRVVCSARVPDLEQIREARARFRPTDVIVAVGGGKVIDTAKLIGGGDLPIVAAPTTAGSGSEATRFATYYVDGVKQSADHEALRPAWAIVDPRLTRGMSAETAAASGFDALGHALESSWSVRSTAESQRLAYQAVALVAAHLPGSVAGEPSSREAMSRAAHLAGRAIDQTRTTAAHALSYTLTWTYRIRHGHAVALTLGRLLEHNAGVTDADCVDPRGPAHVRRTIDTLCGLLGCASARDARLVLRRWMVDCGLTPYPTALGLGPADLARAVAGVDRARLGNNPRTLDRDALAALFETDPARGDLT